jgi:hypothetical protein
MYLAGNYHRNQMIHQIRSVLALPWAYQLFFTLFWSACAGKNPTPKVNEFAEKKA